MSDCISTRPNSLNLRRSLSPQPQHSPTEGTTLWVPPVKRSASFQGLRTRTISSPVETLDFSKTLPSRSSLTRSNSFIRRIKSPLARRKPSTKSEFLFENVSESSSPVVNGFTNSLLTGAVLSETLCIESTEERRKEKCDSAETIESLSPTKDVVFAPTDAVLEDDVYSSMESLGPTLLSPTSTNQLSVQMRKYREPFINLLRKAGVNRMNSKSRLLNPAKIGRTSPTSFIRSGFKRIRNLGSGDSNKITNFANSMSTPRNDKMSNVLKGNVF